MGKYRTSNQKEIIANPCVAKPQPDEIHRNLNPNVKDSRRNGNSLTGLSASEWKRLKRHVILLIWAVVYIALVSTSSSSGASAASVSTGQPPVKPTPSPAPAAKSPPVASKFASIFHRSTTAPVTNFIHTEDDYDFLLTVKPNCSWPSADNFPTDLFTQEQRRNGWVTLHFLASLVVFYTILLVCDDYFVPSIECFCRELHMSSDVAGATLMAISTSAPELATNVIGTFITKGDLGVGTIVGSTVFNILAVGSCCGIGASLAVNKIRGEDGRVGIPLEWWPLTRDCLFYFASVGLLLIVLANRRVDWYEALTMCLFYLVYIMIMCNNQLCKSFTETIVYGVRDFVCGKRPERRPERLSITVPKSNKRLCIEKNGNIEKSYMTERTPLITVENDVGYKADYQIESSTSNEHHYDVSATIIDEVLINKALTRSESQCVIEQAEWGLCNLPYGQRWTVWLEWIISWPIRVLLRITIPDCREYRYRKWYSMTLVMCIVWISGLSYFVSWMMSIIGETLYIPDSVTGLSFLAAGTSIPEVVSSVIVARQGLGSMGLSNSIGSNTFDILVCLGLPWLIQTTILASTNQDDFILINSGALEYSVFLLFASIIVFYLIVVANRFLLDIKVGIASLVLYVIFLVLACLLEMNFFFPVNLPPCVD